MQTEARQIYSLVFRRITRLLIMIGVIIALVNLLPKLEDIFILIIISLLLYALLVPLVNSFESKGIPRWVSIALVYVLGLLVIGMAFEFIIPPIISEAQSLNRVLTEQGPEKVFENMSGIIESYLPMVETKDVTKKMGEVLSSVFQRGVGVVLGIFSAFTSLLMILFMTFFLLKDQRMIKKALIGMVPNRYFEMSLVLVYRIELALSRYIRGALVAGSVVAILSSIGLAFLGVPFFYLVGIIAGLTNLIPYMGPLIGASVAIIVALMNDPGNLMIIAWIAGLFAFVQLIDNIFVTPIVVSQSVDLHPFVVMLAVLVGGSLLGAAGLIFAVPLTSVLKVTIEELVKGLKSYRLV